ncbi:Sphingosine-1-phosphate phosphatase 1 [Bulinus truncatus]|nr:Sphingosine-1-phosphate phosphatase 1 [Bulinus truncatus]
MNILNHLADPLYVAKFQRLCGIVVEKPVTCDQHTQTRNHFSSESSSEDSNGEQEKKHQAQCIERLRQRSNNNTVDNNETDEKNTEANEKTKRSVCSSAELVEQKILTNNNEIKENDKNVAISKKTEYRNGYNVIHPTSRVYGKGSIFENTNNAESLPPENSDTPSVTTSVHIKYKSLLYLAYFGAFLGNEGFYLTFFPFCVWNLDCQVTRQTAYLWCVVMYLGQATKDYLRWPRPPCPPVVRLETHYIQEYSMPSTHAMAGTAIPLYLAYITVEKYQVPVYLAAIGAVLWFSITCLSRIYLGVHTFLDLLAGFVYAILIFFSFIKYVEDFDAYHQTHLFASVIVLFTGLALCTVCYPTNFKSSSKGDAVQIVASLTGVAIGMWLCYQLGYSHDTGLTGPYSISYPSWEWAIMSLIRFVTGVLVIFEITYNLNIYICK